MPHILGFGALCLAAVLIHYSLMFMMASLSFWTVRAQGMMMAYYNLFSIARLPDVVFRGTARAMFTLAIPMLVVANIPVKLICRKLETPGELLILLAMVAVCFLASQWVWLQAMKRYSSASS